MNGYSIHEHGQMLADRVRVEAYLSAMRQAIDDTSVVLDLGTGTGIFAVWACRLGARRVYAVEPTDSIQVAREVAAENNYQEEIVFLQALSTDIALPERADVIVSDIRGILPLHGRHLPSIADARERFLAPGGRLIPERDSMWLAVTELPRKYDEITRPWSSEQYGLQMQAARRLVTNDWYKCRVSPEQLLTESTCWARLDYMSLSTPHCGAETHLLASRCGTAHGLCLWFDSVLAAGVCLSNAPGEDELIYGQAFFPFPQPIDLDQGDDVLVRIGAHLAGDRYVWTWETRVGQGEDPDRVKAHFQQSTFCGTPVSLDNLRRRSPAHVPRLTPEGQTARYVLGFMGTHLCNAEIARRLFGRFPSRFSDLDAAESYVNDLAVQFSVPSGAS